MSLTLESELEIRVRRKAAERGRNADAYLSQLIAAALHQPVPAIIRSTLTKEEFIHSWLQGAERAKARNLPSPDSDFRREDIYDDEESE